MNDTSRLPTPLSPSFETPSWGLSPLEQRRIAARINDAFAILCVRVSGNSRAEKQLRLGFEAILRQLGSSPLRAITRSPLPAYAAPSATASDLRQIIKALESCIATFERYGAILTPAQSRVESLIRATRCFALEELRARTTRPRENPVLSVSSRNEVLHPIGSEVPPTVCIQTSDIAVPAGT